MMKIMEGRIYRVKTLEEFKKDKDVFFRTEQKPKKIEDIETINKEDLFIKDILICHLPFGEWQPREIYYLLGEKVKIERVISQFFLVSIGKQLFYDWCLVDPLQEMINMIE